MSDFRIRDGKLPEDAPIGQRFIFGLQEFEKTMEADRRLDATVAQEFFAVLMHRVGERRGRIFIAEDLAGAAIGWGVGFVEDNEIYIVEDERSYGYISELYVVEGWRGKGVGQALIKACEDHFRALKLKVMMIGVLAKNGNARRSYISAGFRPYSEMLQKRL